VARRALLLTAALAALVAPDAALATRGLDLGFLDGVYSADSAQRGPWLQRTAETGADIVRIDIGWDAPNTPQRPAPFDARNPADPAYDFSRADAAIKDATAHGLRVLASFSGAPRWAEGPGRPADASPGSWRPDPQALEEYGAALAQRYSGQFPDPARPGQALPAVKAFQVWNEPNLDKYLSPQWSGDAPAAPAQYRRMLNAFYKGVKSVRPDDLVVTAGTGPFGDPQPGGRRIMPARFVRELLCLGPSGAPLRRATCQDPARFDVLAHHPYSVNAPDAAALNADDVSIPDLGKLTRLLRSAERAGNALPRTRHPLWVTEVGYNSAPPNPEGVPLATHARWLEQTLYELWRQGVSTIIWYPFVDQPPVPSYSTTSQAGVYFLDGRPKPALSAFRFPLVAQRAGHRGMRIWGRAPEAGTLRIEQETRSGWRPLRTMRVHAHAVFTTAIARRGGMSLRAQIGNETSPTWQTG
jgi:hypothetical protein